MIIISHQLSIYSLVLAGALVATALPTTNTSSIEHQLTLGDVLAQAVDTNVTHAPQQHHLVSPLYSLNAIWHSVNSSNVVPMPDKPVDQPFSNWSDARVQRLHGQLGRFMSRTHLTDIGLAGGHDPFADLESDTPHVTTSPRSVYRLAAEARERFRDLALPAVNQTCNELPAELLHAMDDTTIQQWLSQSSLVAVGNADRQLAVLPTDSISQPLSNDLDTALRTITDSLTSGRLRGILASLLGVDMALRITGMLAPITVSALMMLVNMLKRAAKTVLAALVVGQGSDEWLALLRKQLVQDLRDATLAMLSHIKQTLETHLAPLLLSALSTALQLGRIGQFAVNKLLGQPMNALVQRVVSRQLDRLSAHLRQLWNIPVVRTLLNRWRAARRAGNNLVAASAESIK